MNNCKFAISISMAMVLTIFLFSCKQEKEQSNQEDSAAEYGDPASHGARPDSVIWSFRTKDSALFLAGHEIPTNGRVRAWFSKESIYHKTEISRYPVQSLRFPSSIMYCHPDGYYCKTIDVDTLRYPNQETPLSKWVGQINERAHAKIDSTLQCLGPVVHEESLPVHMIKMGRTYLSARKSHEGQIMKAYRDSFITDHEKWSSLMNAERKSCLQKDSSVTETALAEFFYVLESIQKCESAIIASMPREGVHRDPQDSLYLAELDSLIQVCSWSSREIWNGWALDYSNLWARSLRRLQERSQGDDPYLSILLMDSMHFTLELEQH